MEALTRLRLVNRSNLGVPRMFSALLIEGKEPPVIEEQGEAVKVTFLASELAAEFRSFVEEENRQGRLLSVDQLLVLQYLLRHSEIDTATAARICQRRDSEAREILSQMERAIGYLERGGTGKGRYWVLRTEVHRRLSGPGHPERDRRTDWEAAKTRVQSVLRQRAARGESGLSNADVRQITHLGRNQVVRLMNELRAEDPKVRPPGRGRWARYSYRVEEGA